MHTKSYLPLQVPSPIYSCIVTPKNVLNKGSMCSHSVASEPQHAGMDPWKSIGSK